MRSNDFVKTEKNCLRKVKYFEIQKIKVKPEFS